MSDSVPSTRRPDRRAIFSWCLFDWANNSYPTVITTFLFAAYFTRAVAETPEQGTFLWGQATGLAGQRVNPGSSGSACCQSPPAPACGS